MEILDLTFATGVRGWVGSECKADPCAFLNDCGFGHSHFQPRSHLGRQGSGGHPSARGAAEFYASAHQYTAGVLASGGRFWINEAISECGRPGARLNSSDESIHRHPKLCQRLLHHGAVSFFLLVSGDIFVHRLVEILPRFSETPMLLARRFTLNPVLVIISLVFWFWMWGVPGMILSMPMLAITKIICDRLQPLAAFGHFLEG